MDPRFAELTATQVHAARWRITGSNGAVRGYVEEETKSDIIVKVAAGTGAIPNPAADRALPGGPARGFIVIHIYDAPTGTEVWQGSAFAEIDPEKIDDALLKMGVEHMMAEFPTRKPAPVADIP
jgi:hypothetical protein